MNAPPLSLNQATTKRWNLVETARGCAAAGIGAIGPWRDRVQEVGAASAARIVADCGLTVTSLCRGGFFAEPGSHDENLRALDEAAAVGAPVLVVVPGGLAHGERDLARARRRVADSMAALVEPAAARGVQLGLEPMHPMFCADRGVVSTLRQALDVVEELPDETAGVVVDTYHVWWDPDVEEQIRRAGRRLALVQVADWVTPLPADALLGRAYAGDGRIDIARLVGVAYDAGYAGAVEVELFNQAIWDTPGEEILRTVVARHQALFAAAGSNQEESP